MLNKIQSKTISNSTEKERVMDTKEAKTITDLNQFKASESKTVNRNNNGEGIMSVVNAKTGKRITLSRQLMDKLNNPERIVISFNHNKIAIAKQLPNKWILGNEYSRRTSLQRCKGRNIEKKTKCYRLYPRWNNR